MKLFPSYFRHAVQFATNLEMLISLYYNIGHQGISVMLDGGKSPYKSLQRKKQREQQGKKARIKYYKKHHTAYQNMGYSFTVHFTR